MKPSVFPSRDALACSLADQTTLGRGGEKCIRPDLHSTSADQLTIKMLSSLFGGQGPGPGGPWLALAGP